MTGDGFQKTGWHWTLKGWKRTPKHLATVKKVPAPSKRRRRKKQIVAEAPPRVKPPTHAAMRRKLIEWAKAKAAPTPAPEAEKPATRQMRRAWLGKYDDLNKPS